MKKILFVTSGLTHGGVNKSLLNLLSKMNRDNFEIDIYSLYQSGPYRKLFDGYSLLPTEGIAPTLLGYNAFSESNTLIDFYIKISTHLFPKSYCEKIGRTLSEKNYDIVVSFQEGFTTRLATYIKAKKHIAWIHCDYSRYINNKKHNEANMYQRYDHIVAVSEYTAKVVKEYLPSVADKVTAIYNVMDSEGILSLSKVGIDDERFKSNDFTLISIGRMDPVKRFSHIPAIARELKRENILFRWYIIGDGGSEKEQVIEEIKKNNVQNEVILLGAKNNPYSYLKHANVLVCPSLSEAYPNVVNEAKILHIPVVAADFPSAKELIDNGVNGYISPISEIPSILQSLCLNTQLYNKLCENIRNYNYENRSILQKVYELFDC